MHSSPQVACSGETIAISSVQKLQTTISDSILFKYITDYSISMSESPITTSSAVLTTENDHNVSEHTALLPNGPPADRPRRTSSVIGTTEHGYLIIPPPELLEDQIDPPKESRGILAILSVLLVGQFFYFVLSMVILIQ